MRIRLADSDRERLGIEEEWLPFDAARITMREAELLQQVGYETVGEWRQAAAGKPIVVDGHFVFETDPETGERILDEDLLPIPKTRTDYRAIRALTWVCLRRNGHPLEWADADFDLEGWGWEADPEPGKDETTSTPTDPLPN